jgi:hypothetical protein
LRVVKSGAGTHVAHEGVHVGAAAARKAVDGRVDVVHRGGITLSRVNVGALRTRLAPEALGRPGHVLKLVGEAVVGVSVVAQGADGAGPALHVGVRCGCARDEVVQRAAARVRALTQDPSRELKKKPGGQAQSSME